MTNKLYGVKHVGILKGACKNINVDIILASQLLKNDNMFKFNNIAMKVKPYIKIEYFPSHTICSTKITPSILLQFTFSEGQKVILT